MGLEGKVVRGDELIRSREPTVQGTHLEVCPNPHDRGEASNPDSGILGLLGMCELELGRTRDAAAHLDAFLREYRGDRSEAVKQASEAFQRATAEVATFDVQTKPAGATLELDGKAVGKAPTKIFVEPGAAQLVARLEGYQDAERALDAVAGEDVAVELVLEAAPGGAAPPGGDASSAPPLWPVFVLGGASLVGFGVGITGLIVSGSAGSEAETLIHDDDCDAACLANVDDELSTEGTFRGVGIGGLVAGDVLAAAATVYAVVAVSSERESESERDSLQDLWVGPQLGSATGWVVGGSF